MKNNNSDLEKFSVCRDLRHTAGKFLNTKYLNKIFSLGELEKNSVCADFAHTAYDGKIYSTKYSILKATIRKFRIVQIEGHYPIERLKYV